MWRWIGLAVLMGLVAQVQAKTAELPAKAQRLATNWEMPAFFELNQGQAPSDVLFQARTNELLVQVKQGGFSVIPRAASAQPLHFHFVNALQTQPPQGEQALQARVNYFIGRQSANWQKAIPTYAQLRQSQLYPGIDLVYRFTEHGRLEYDLVVAPGVDASQIRLQLEGQHGPLALSDEGALLLQTTHGPVEQLPPVVFQSIDGQTREVVARYQLLGDNQLGMTLAQYDAEHTLVVDPVLKYSTYLGGNDRDSVRGVAWREADNTLVVTGGTSTVAAILPNNSYTATNSGLLDATLEGTAYQPYSAVEASGCTLNYDPARSNGTQQNYSAYDAFLAKIDLNTGALLYVTYYGGCENEQARDVALDKDGNAYIVGTTKSRDLPTAQVQSELTPKFPGSSSYEVDAFVAKFDSNLQLVYGRYVGGSEADYGRAIAVDVEGYAYIVGNTSSPYIVSSEGLFSCFGRVVPEIEGTSCYMGQTDAFFARIHPSGTVVTHGTYIGGYGTDWAADLAISNDVGAGVKIFVAGTTAATMADPFNPGYRHEFPFKDGNRPYKYYVPGNCGDSGVDFVNDKHPCRDAYVLVMDNMGENLLYTTMVGGAGDDVATGLAIDTSQNIYLTGYSTSEGVITRFGSPGNIEDPKLISTDDDNREVFIRFPLHNTIRQGEYELVVKRFDGTAPKAFLTKFDAISLYKDIQFSTFIGGTDVDKATGVAVSTVASEISTTQGTALVKTNTIYLVGQTLSQDFQPLQQSFKTTADGEDVFLVKMEQREGAVVGLDMHPQTKFATLLGAEGLDSPKGMVEIFESATGTSRGVVIVGKTSSQSYPTTSDAFAPTAIAGPDDGFITYIDDTELSTDLHLKSAGFRLPQKVGDSAEFAFEVENGGEFDAEQVRLAISLPPNVNVTNRPSNCLLEDKRILFCEFGTLEAAGGVSTKSINFGFVPRIGGLLRVRASVQSNIVDNQLDDNTIEMEMTVLEESYNAAYLGAPFAALLLLLLGVSRRLNYSR